MLSRRFDVLAVLAAFLTVMVLVLYLILIIDQGGGPAWWFLVALIFSAAVISVASLRSSPWRRAMLFSATGVLLVVGTLGILTVGMPLLVAAGMCLVAAFRAEPQTQP